MYTYIHVSSFGYQNLDHIYLTIVCCIMQSISSIEQFLIHIKTLRKCQKLLYNIKVHSQVLPQIIMP